MEIAGFLSSILIGVMLGLTGSGGSILAVPILVYLFSLDIVTATAYSLFIVGLTATLGSLGYLRKGLVNIPTALLFAVPSVVAVYFTRSVIVPSIPERIVEIGAFELTKNTLIMIIFAMLMMTASYSMLKKEEVRTGNQSSGQFNYPMIILEGFIIGFITGLVGAGGGFLIIPALVVFSKLRIKEAVGTSLVIISANSLIGFIGESRETIIDWSLLSVVATAATLGLFIGMFLSKKIDGVKLKPAFGWFVLVTGIYIIAKETFFK